MVEWGRGRGEQHKTKITEYGRQAMPTLNMLTSLMRIAYIMPVL